MEFLTLLIPAVLILALCFLGMAVGVLFKDKTFRSCACGSITFRGERIDCPGHVPEPESDEPCANRDQCTRTRCERETA